MDSAEIIRTCRERAGLTPTDLAEKVGTTRDHVYRWERGAVTPTVDSLIAVLRATGFEMIIKEKDEAYYSRDKTRRKKIYG
jgi:transcriptional regulator with XRE-family HTH domain